MHDCTAGGRYVLSRNQQPLKTISFSAQSLADRVNDLAGDTQCQLKETWEDVVACSVAIDGMQT
jgi:hypothetical protein